MTDAVQVAREARDAYRFKANDVMYAAMDAKVEQAIRAALIADVRAAVEAMPTFTVTGGEYRVIRYVDRDAIGAVLDAMARGA